MAEKKSITSDKKLMELLAAAVEIESQDIKAAGALGYTVRALALTTLPYKKFAGEVYRRSNGFAKLTVFSPEGVPYGGIPRILTAWVTSEIVRTGEPVIGLGHSFSEFLGKINYATSGGKTGAATQVRDQAQRLFSSVINIKVEKDNAVGFKNVLMVDSGMMIWDVKKPDERSLWESHMTITQEFFNECLNHKIPVDLRVLQVLRASPMAMDIYVWLVYRMFILRKQTIIPWSGLFQQFGHGNEESEQGLYNFKSEFKRALKKVEVFYPTAKFAVSKDTITLFPSPLHIPRACG